jgi:predicted anti-sigma-YlaC factor YlaD
VNDRESRRCTAGPGVPPPRETLGGYVLGALDPMETDRTAAHLAECEGCRAEYLDLLDLLPLLAVITEQEAVTGPVRPHPDTLEKVLSARSVAETGTPGPPPGPAVPLRGTSALGGPAATVAGAAVGPAVRSRRRPRDSRPPSSGTQPRRRNLVLAIGAAAVVGALVVAGALGLGRGQSSPPQLTAWSASAAATYTKGAEIAASVRVTTNTANSGSLITLTLTGVPTGYSCKMVMFGTDGTRQTSHEWTAPSAGTFSIPGTSTMTPKDIEDIEVQLPDGSVLAQLNQP